MEISHSVNDESPTVVPTISSSAKNRKRPRNENPLEHFDVERYRDNFRRETCRYCHRVFEFEHDCGDIGSQLKRHIEQGSCLGSQGFIREISVPPVFNQNVARKALVKYMLLNDLPIATFRAESPIFHPELKMIKYRQIKATIKELYKEEKQVLVEYFRNYSGKIALSCKFLKSCRGLDYIALTAHYMDSDWKIDKRTLGFRLVRKSNAQVVGEAIVSELRDWGIEKKIYSITLDHYDFNGDLTDYLMNYMEEIDAPLFCDISCFSYIIKSAVRDCLLEIKSFVERIRRLFADLTVARSRRKEFQELGKMLTGVEDCVVFLPDIGRWDLTNCMLECATFFREVVDRYISGKEDEYPPFSDDDWFSANMVKDFLDVFQNATISLCRDYVATSCLVIRQMFEISCVFEKYRSDHMLSRSYTEMKRKLTNYFEEGRPSLFGFSSIIDPRIKLVGLEALLEFIYESGVGDVDSCTYNGRLNDIKSSFEEYFENLSLKLQSEQVSPSSSPPMKRPSWTITYEMRVKAIRNKRSELERYLEDPIVECDDDNFDILNWWKLHKSSYPVLSTMARDLLMVPVSTVFSSSAGEEDEDLLDNERNSVSASMVNRSKCLGDWYKAQRERKMRSVKMEWSSGDEDTEEE